MVTYFVLACVIRIRFVKTKLVILLPANYETRDVDAWFIVRLKLGYVSKTTPPLVWKIRESSWLFCVAFLLARRERGIQARRRRRRRNQRTCICPCGIFLVVTKSWMFSLYDGCVFKWCFNQLLCCNKWILQLMEWVFWIQMTYPP